MRKLYTIAILILIACTSQSLYAQQADHQKLLELVRTHAIRLGLTTEDASAAVISSSYSDASTQIQYVYLQQAHSHIPVFNSIKTILFRNNDVLYWSGHFVPDMTGKAGTATPALSAPAAVIQAARHLELAAPTGLQVVEEKENGRMITLTPAGIAKQEILAELCWVASADNSSVRLAWNVNIDVKGSPDWWNVRIDALNGNYLEKDNWTVHEAGHLGENKAGTDDYRFYAPPPPTVTGAGYYVVPFPYESPKHQALSLETQPWLKAGAGNPAITNGWHFDGTNNYNITRGNNVFAYLDLLNNNTRGGTMNLPDTSSTAIPSLSFSNVPNFGQQPAVSTNRKAAVTNLFYWNIQYFQQSIHTLQTEKKRAYLTVQSRPTMRDCISSMAGARMTFATRA